MCAAWWALSPKSGRIMVQESAEHSESVASDAAADNLALECDLGIVLLPEPRHARAVRDRILSRQVTHEAPVDHDQDRVPVVWVCRLRNEHSLHRHAYAVAGTRAGESPQSFLPVRLSVDLVSSPPSTTARRAGARFGPRAEAVAGGRPSSRSRNPLFYLSCAVMRSASAEAWAARDQLSAQRSKSIHSAQVSRARGSGTFYVGAVRGIGLKA
jgi:hypothetical protein